MNFFVLHFSSGQAFFFGIFLIVLSAWCSLSTKQWLKCHLSRLTAIIGIINIILSSTPLPLVLYIVIIMISITQLIISNNTSIRKKYRLSIVIIQTITCLCALFAELPYWLDKPQIAMKSNRIFIIGDSLGAGVGYKGEKTWGDILQEQCNYEVINKAVGGGTVSSSIKSLAKVKQIRHDELIILEIGGNDLLRGTPAPRFRSELKKLLAVATSQTSTVMMLELPLPPFSNAYASAQRELSKEFHILLIPKRFFAQVLKGGESTVDGLHLSNIGHRKMATVIATHLIPAPQQSFISGKTGQ